MSRDTVLAAGNEEVSARGRAGVGCGATGTDVVSVAGRAWVSDDAGGDGGAACGDDVDETADEDGEVAVAGESTLADRTVSTSTKSTIISWRQLTTILDWTRAVLTESVNPGAAGLDAGTHPTSQRSGQGAVRPTPGHNTTVKG